VRIAAAILLSIVALSSADPSASSVGVGARAYGMGNNFTALSNDFSSLYWNPAGMAFIVAREAHLALDWNRRDASVEFGGKTTDATMKQFKVASGGLLRSLPTTRGGYAFALGFLSPYMLDDLRYMSGIDVYRGSVPLPGFSDTLYSGDTLQRTKSNRYVTGQLNLWSMGMGWQIAPGLGFGFSLGLLTGGENSRVEKVTATRRGKFGDTVFTFESAYFGYDARIGLLYAPSKLFSFGCRVELPRRAKVAENDILVDRLDQNGSDEFTNFGVLESPFIGAFGVAANAPFATVSADVTARAPFADAPLHTDGSHWKGGGGVGLEIPVPWIASLMRGGYSYSQFDSSPMQIDWDEWGIDPGEKATVLRNRHLVTAGYSLLCGSSFSLEAAYGYERWDFTLHDADWESDIKEAHVRHRVMISAAVRY
jgi:hypothetical protein